QIEYTQKGIQQGLQASKVEDARESAENIAAALAISGENRFEADSEVVEDYSFEFEQNGIVINKNVWVSTGCPVPNVPKQIEFGDFVDLDREYKEYDAEGNLTTTTLLEKCFGRNYEHTGEDHYFVYPSSVVNEPYKAPITVSSDCEPNQLYKTYNDV